MYAPCYNGSLAFSPNKEEAERTERIFQEARAERARERDEIDEMAQEDKPALEEARRKAEVAAMEKEDKHRHLVLCKCKEQGCNHSWIDHSSHVEGCPRTTYRPSPVDHDNADDLYEAFLEAGTFSEQRDWFAGRSGQEQVRILTRLMKAVDYANAHGLPGGHAFLRRVLTEGTDEHRFFRKGRKRVITQLRKYVRRFYVNTKDVPLTLLQQKTWLLGSKPCVQLYVLKRLIDRVDWNRETPQQEDVRWRPIETEFIAKVKQAGTAEREFFLNMTEGVFRWKILGHWNVHMDEAIVGRVRARERTVHRLEARAERLGKKAKEAQRVADWKRSSPGVTPGEIKRAQAIAERRTREFQSAAARAKEESAGGAHQCCTPTMPPW